MSFDPIPAIDLLNGKAVRLAQGDFRKVKIYHNNPVELAQRFADHGIRRLHLVDLEGARSQSLSALITLEEIMSETDLEVDFGGGLQKAEDLERIFNAGAKYASIGSIAATDPNIFLTWLADFGPDRLILNADNKNGKVAVRGWQETTEEDIYEYIADYVEDGVTQVLATDVSRDGMQKGPNLEMYKKLRASCPKAYLLGSGGVRDVKDLHALHEAGANGAVIGTAYYEGKITIPDLKSFL